LLRVLSRRQQLNPSRQQTPQGKQAMTAEAGF